MPRGLSFGLGHENAFSHFIMLGATHLDIAWNILQNKRGALGSSELSFIWSHHEIWWNIAVLLFICAHRYSQFPFHATLKTQGVTKQLQLMRPDCPEHKSTFFVSQLKTKALWIKVRRSFCRAILLERWEEIAQVESRSIGKNRLCMESMHLKEYNFLFKLFPLKSRR